MTRANTAWRWTIAVILLLAVAPASSALASAPGRNGGVAMMRFVQETVPCPDGRLTCGEDRWFVYTARRDGSQLRPLTGCSSGGEGPCEGLFPEWSPDGKRLVFAREGGNLRVVRADGTGFRRVANARASSASWSPDGRKLVFAVDGEGIFTARLDGSGRRRIAKRGMAPVWSSRNQIAFVRSEPAEIIVMDAAGTNARRAAFGNAPDWSPGGTKLVFERGERTYVVRRDGTGLRQLAQVRAFAPVWSPDGRLIAYDGGNEFGVMDPDGSNARPLFGAQPEGTYAALAWQPRPR